MLIYAVYGPERAPRGALLSKRAQKPRMGRELGPGQAQVSMDWVLNSVPRGTEFRLEAEFLDHFIPDPNAGGEVACSGQLS